MEKKKSILKEKDKEDVPKDHETPETNSTGFPKDVDFKRFLGCGG